MSVCDDRGGGGFSECDGCQPNRQTDRPTHACMHACTYDDMVGGSANATAVRQTDRQTYTYMHARTSLSSMRRARSIPSCSAATSWASVR